MTNTPGRRGFKSGGRLATNGGMTLVELMIAGFIGAIILMAAFTMYLTSMETWDVSGARLALQRNGDRVVKQIAFDIRHGDHVAVGADSTSIVITRTMLGTTSTLQTYALSGDEVVNQFGTVLTNNVTEMRFSSGNGVKVWISMTLSDDMGTSALPFDDQRVEINSLAVCRNEPS
ncbi:MAG: prepilin-type N-terminal cleavage/methylation domain-containing protein [Candidatus Eisenbacteria bacterium]